MIGVRIKQLKKIPDDRGTIMRIADNKDIKKFGQVYVSTVNPGVVKGWHYHKEMTLNYCVIRGMIKLVLHDGKDFQEVYMGDRNYCLVTIRPEIWNGFMGIGTKEAIVVNTVDIPYDVNEIVRAPYDRFRYDWSVKNR